MSATTWTFEDRVWKEAQAWAGMGYTPIPLRWYSKRPVVKWSELCAGGIDECMIDYWFKGIRRNLGVMLTGDLVVVDFDRPARYVAWATTHSLPTRTVKTNRGWHVYVRVAHKPVTTMSMDGGEIKATGYVVVPPSLHPSGKPYRTVVDAPIAMIESLSAIGIYGREPILPPHGDWTALSYEGPSVVHLIKDEVGIVEYLSRITDGFCYHGNALFCRCPFHDDHEPSLMVVPEEQRCFCFSPRCQAHRQMDVINVCALWLGLTNTEAIRYLSQEV